MYIPTLLFTTLASCLSVAQAAYGSSPTPATTATSQCVHTITAHQAFGCVITNAAAVTTESIDCKGCVISTSTAVNGFFGHGPVCFNGRKTMTDPSLTATVQACATA